MATTPKLGLTLLEIGQKEKEATINDALTKIDTAVNAKSGWLGKLAADPAPTATLVGSIYYNTATSKIRMLIDATTWVDV